MGEVCRRCSQSATSSRPVQVRSLGIAAPEECPYLMLCPRAFNKCSQPPRTAVSTPCVGENSVARCDHSIISCSRGKLISSAVGSDVMMTGLGVSAQASRFFDLHSFMVVETIAME